MIPNLLAFWKEIPWSPVESHHKVPAMRNFDIFFIVSQVFYEEEITGDMRHHDSHVTSH